MFIDISNKYNLQHELFEQSLKGKPFSFVFIFFYPKSEYWIEQMFPLGILLSDLWFKHFTCDRSMHFRVTSPGRKCDEIVTHTNIRNTTFICSRLFAYSLSVTSEFCRFFYLVCFEENCQNYKYAEIYLIMMRPYTGANPAILVWGFQTQIDFFRGEYNH